MASTFDTTTAIGDDDIDIRVEYEAWWQPAKLYGEPENCHEAEGDMELLAVTPLQELPEGMTLEQFNAHCERLAGRLDEQAWEHFHERD